MLQRLLRLLIAALFAFCLSQHLSAQFLPQYMKQTNQHTVSDGQIKKVLFIGDSMTGWLAERLNAYGAENGFEVSAVIWDGSTIRKWGNAPLEAIIEREKPDAVFMSLGLNELLERNPERRYAAALDNILKAVGNRKFVWVGPPSWPGKGKGETLNNWLADKLGDTRYFNSSALTLQRQSATNPHPTRAATQKWADTFVEWLGNNDSISFGTLARPTQHQMLRGKSYTHVRMKDTPR